MDLSTWLGLAIGFGGIILGNLFEGGHFGSLVQFTAFVIVSAGTCGAVMVSNTSQDLKTGWRLLVKVLSNNKIVTDSKNGMEEIVDLARQARRENILSMEALLRRTKNRFVSDIVKNIIDGVELNQIREMFENEIDTYESDLLAGAKIWMDAGGFAPTIGIIGAVLGLIHVMGNLSDTSKLGAGIAVAFVATIYGVTFANLLFLPMGNKIKKLVHKAVVEKKALLEGALMIAGSQNPILIEQKMLSFLKKEENY